MSKFPKYFRDVDDCSICPFSYDNASIFCSDYTCNGSPDGILPCTEERYANMTLDEVVEFVDSERRVAYNAILEERKFEEELRRKSKERADKSKETRFENREINSKISVLRKRIRDRNLYIRRIEAFTGAIEVTNSFFPNIHNEDILKSANPQLNKFYQENLEDEAELKKLISIRDKRNRERRKNQKK